MANNITYTQLWQTNLDKQATQSATSGWMESNAGQIVYTGGKEVKVPKLDMDGLGDYDRPNALYPKGSVNLTYETKTLTQDRGKEFTFDRHDVDETAYILNASQIMSEFQRKFVIPEIDAYRYSKIASYAGITPIVETITVANVLSSIKNQLNAVRNLTGMDLREFVITMNFNIYGILTNSSELQNTLQPQNFNQGDLSFMVNSIDGVPIIPVQSTRMKNSYVFQDGKSNNFGFTPSPTAKDINWIIMPRSNPIAISKTDNIKQFSPDVNQDGDAWKIQYRKYHDLWLLDNKLQEIVVSLKV